MELKRPFCTPGVYKMLAEEFTQIAFTSTQAEIDSLTQAARAYTREALILR